VPIDERWRERARERQVAALPRGRVALSCPAPLDSGGLGRHQRELLDALERLGEPHSSMRLAAPGVSGQETAAAGRELQAGPIERLAAPLGRVSRAWRVWARYADFDRTAARLLDRQGEHLLAFNGAALAQLRKAARGDWQSLSLVSANPHFRHVVRQHAKAHAQYPIERPWVSRLLGRNLAEYRAAQRIYVASQYVRESFLAEGHEDSALELFPLTPHPRFKPAPEPTRSSTFDVLYIGSLTVHKGVPLLLDAFGRLPHEDIRLLLVGGWSTRPMRRFLERACAADARVRIAPGDPLAALRRARLYVHPAYEDGFAYAAAEALACGVPLIVSEDTGMKELIDPGRDGLLTPTGDADALAEAIDGAYRGELLGA
jgi:glycosyltransferase involved in cell wall biosynthesis